MRSGAKARLQWYTPPQHTPKVLSHSSRLPVRKLPPPPMPALLNTRLTRSVSCCAITRVAGPRPAGTSPRSPNWLPSRAWRDLASSEVEERGGELAPTLHRDGSRVVAQDLHADVVGAGVEVGLHACADGIEVAPHH